MPAHDEIQIEFFGVARHRTQVASAVIPVGPEGLSVPQLWNVLSERFPLLLAGLDATMEPAVLYSLNLDGQRFLDRQPATILPGQTVLVLSADAGG
jgi:hypothetical protein